LEDHESLVARSLEQYEARLPRLNRASDAIGHAIRARLRDDGLNHHTVQSRVKDPVSVRGKLDRLTADGRFKYEHGLEQLDDLIGVRVIMFLEPDIADVATALKGQFNCREDDDKTSSQRRNGQIGYAGRHLILEVPAENVPVGCQAYIGERFEVQIRTVLQHAWAAFEHDIRYKGLAESNAEVDRAFTMASTLIELADAQFSAINDIVKRRQAESTAGFAVDPAATELTGDILQDMLARLLPEHPRSQARQYTWLGDLLAANGVRTVADAEGLFGAADWSGVAKRMDYKFRAGHVRIADDFLLKTWGPDYIARTKSLGDDPKREAKLTHRLERMQD
jgi:ppGpp synthetase/RelA/SpoT-type nucleotidyltranferase